MAEQEVLILRCGRYLDSAKIVTFFSLEGGRTAGFARGATARDNRFGASLEPLTRSRLSLRRATFSGLVRILHADVIDSYPRLRSDYDRLIWAGLVVRFLLGFLPDHHPEPALFRLACEALGGLDREGGLPGEHWEDFAREALALLGWGIPEALCRRCGLAGGQGSSQGPISPEMFFFRLADGAVLCQRCRLADSGGDLWAVEPEILNHLSQRQGVVGTGGWHGRGSPPLRERLGFLDRVIGGHLPRWTAVADLTFVGREGGLGKRGGGAPPGSEDEEVDADGGREHDQRT